MIPTSIMAEGGGEEVLHNPFSFKTYVKKKSKQHDEQDINTKNIFTTTSRKKEKHSLVIGDEDDSVPSSDVRKKDNKENPFSFKKFLDQSGQKESESLQQKNLKHYLSRDGPPLSEVKVKNCGHSNNTIASTHQGQNVVQNAAVPPDFASDLPDFIQNHFSDDQSKLDHERWQLPDFTLQAKIPQDGGSKNGAAAASVFELGQEERLEDRILPGNEIECAQKGQQLSLPDFLVDSAVPGTVGKGEDSKDFVNIRTEGELSRSRIPELPLVSDSVNETRSRSDATVRQLQDENRRLKEVIAELQHKALEEEARVAGFEKEITRLRKKELEETAVMERAVQQVEENLVATTTRAVQAETLVAKLKQEVKTLQAQVKVLSSESKPVHLGDQGLSDIRERTKYASEQLATAAITAENNLKELLGGVEKLKLLGLVLSSIEKVTDIDSSPSQDSARASPI